MKKNRPEPVTVELARKLTGYRSHPNRESVFGRETGYPGQPWAGSFVHEVLREAGLLETAMISTTDALAWYMARNRVSTVDPQPGDIVFYAFPSTGEFSQPHIGVVTETDRYKTTGEFRAVEGETGSGLSRGSRDRDGVFERLRYQPDVLGFVRPREPRPVSLVGIPEDVPTVRPTNFSRRSPLRGTATTAVQFAIFDITGFNKFAQGEWDGLTRSAFGEFLRTVGLYGEVEEIPTEMQLEALADASMQRYFRTPDRD